MAKKSFSRGLALKSIAAIPFGALALTATLSPAQAADNKKQFKYQDKPGPHGQKCSGCRLFRPPSGCSVVTGKISPNGWCIAWVKR
jgi:High potential iron-sulfur protein